MATLQIQCFEKAITIKNSPVIASGGINVDTLEVDFCEKWTGFTKTAVFYQNAENVYYSVLQNDICIIPYEALKTEGILYFGLFGVKGDERITTEILRYKITKGAITDFLKPSEPSDEIWEQVLKELNAIRDLAEDIKQNETDFINKQTEAFNTLKKDTETKFEQYKTSTTNELNKFKNDIEQDNANFKETTEKQFYEYYNELKEISANFMSIEDIDRILGGDYDELYDIYNAQAFTIEDLEKILI